MPSVLLGLVSYPLAFALSRGLIMLLVSALLGADLAFERLPEILLIVTLLIVAHIGIGLIATAAVVAFRTSFSIPEFVMMASSFLGWRVLADQRHSVVDSTGVRDAPNLVRAARVAARVTGGPSALRHCRRRLGIGRVR